MKKRGFTLAEVMVVLSVIGVLTAILLPAAFKATPDELAMKAKKGYNTFGAAVRELAVSDKYYFEGDFNKKANGSAAKSLYFCNSLADLLSTKNASCSGAASGTATATQANIDSSCVGKTVPTDANSIRTADDIKFYRASSTDTSFPTTTDGNGFYTTYIAMCMAVSSKGATEVFGMGVRVDGKVVPGTKLSTWLSKDIQQTD